ncbi:Histidine kinase-like ATPase, C-terminal domain containing protein [Parasponia andersonii]|uniref:Histidine kinase-like ATPase, C-terminal domain containing protein n=1 Tax=Parasponia andersonii TaxID=3476 RepID=A0A2P5DE13_PARAD|nr:Histidine kinase-like ATPase, C-terminal domain containing protein [Parasponia andersonii]
MPPKIDKEAITVVDICSRDEDEDGGAGVSNGNSDASSNKPPSEAGPPVPPMAHRDSATTTAVATTTTPFVSVDQSFDHRSFWKAGSYAVDPSIKPPLAQEQLEHARVHPKFLHSNATSHKWAFGAIAELLDNAVDEIHNGATFVKVDKIDVMKDNSPALLFQDDGRGMDPECIRKCMSLGYSSKKANTTIGQYGNGFKTSTMRLGADVIVLSRAICKSQATQSVGLLSYTFLRKTGQDDVIVPMIDFDISSNWAEPIIYGSNEDWSSNLKTILEWSPFASKEDLMLQFEDIGAHGTKVIIYNLWLNDEGIYELNFDDDDEDIRLRDEANCGSSIKLSKKVVERQAHISYHIRYSLRAYASMLYLRKFANFKIILRGKPVEQFNIADELQYRTTVAYRPQVSTMSSEAVETTIGFIKEAPSLNVSGFNVYHKNRLIRPFWKVTADGTSKGSGVVGVLEANFIEPAHDKQDFERSSLFIRLETRLKQMVNDYWKSHCHHMGYQTPGSSAHNMQKDHPVQSSLRLAANIQKQLPANRTTVGHPANVVQELSNSEPPGFGQRTNFHRDLPPGFYEVVGLAPVDEKEHSSVDQMCEENIQLFLRCDEYMKKQTELKQMIVGLEKELEESKRKCVQLAAYLETKKKQNLLNQTSEKV